MDWKAQNPGRSVEEYLRATSGARVSAQEKRARDTANIAISALPDVRNELLVLRDKLGPVGGRKMEIGRAIGSTDNTYVMLRANTDLAVSALSVIHFGARGNWQWLQDFKGNLDEGKLTYENLVSGWSVIEKWLRRYSKMGEEAIVDEGVPAPGVVNAPAR